MGRILFTYLVPFFAPMAVYLAWAYYRARYVAEHGGEAPSIERGPWPLLLFLGAVLAFATLSVTALTRGGSAGAIYTPSHLENGQVVPGRMDDASPAKPN